MRTLDSDNRVVFNLVKILNDDGGSVWISGLPETATLITVGQELVVLDNRSMWCSKHRREIPAAAPGRRAIAK